MKTLFLVLTITLLGFLLRIIHIDQNPPALNWDYVSVGYNAYSILKTGADEYGVRFPLLFRSYDVYNLPVGIYLTVPFVWLFGLSEIAVRTPAVLFGTLTIPLTFLLTQAFTRKKNVALLATLFLTISPWHIQYSREATISILYVFFIILGTWFLLASREKPVFFLLGILSFALSFYTYHAALVFGMLWLVTLTILYRKSLPPKKWLLGSSIVLLFLLLPLLFNSFAGEASHRLRATGVIYTQEDLIPWIHRIDADLVRGDEIGSLLHNRRVFYAFHILRNYFAHWRLDYLFFDGMANRMFRIPDMGLFYLWDLPFLLVGIWILLKTWKEASSKILLAWFLLVPVPSALAWGAPAALRVVPFLPLLQIFIALGFFSVLKRTTFARRPILFAAALALLLNVAYFSHQLYVHAPKETAESWNYSVKHAVQLVRQHENQYDRIIFTNRYHQPYMYYLFYNTIDPSWTQEYSRLGPFRIRTVGKIEFRHIEWERDILLQNTLIVASSDELPDGHGAPIDEILSLNGERTLVFLDTNQTQAEKDAQEPQEAKPHTQP